MKHWGFSVSLGILLLALLNGGCGDTGSLGDDTGSSDDTSSEDDDTSPSDDDSTPDDDSAPPFHVLVSSDGWGGGPDHGLLEVDSSFQVTWLLDLGSGAGAQGIWRFDDGLTLFTRVGNLDAAVSSVDLIDGEGTVLWTWMGADNNFIDFPHGVVVTAASEYIIADTNNRRVLAIDAEGNGLWGLNEYGTDASHPSFPNGLDLRKGEDGMDRLLVSSRIDDTLPGGVEMVRRYRLGGRGEAPVLEWQFPATPNS